ncbi:amidohydrolase [Brumicola pallidula]|uniref:Amidohydrolase 3 n=1 Tax=Brumicola pallidula DSM 14239 = ACAM 615 TaxID=1121922 RepID=K6ZFT3_9ALTE|nr:amidohydrolase [Glaciecola pallidula]GAC29222.1 amidohydrolase 3 [Glaciecola pallidula DSM 14239 = ACAM 615]
MNSMHKIRFSITLLVLVLTSTSAFSLTFIENVKGYTLNQQGKLITFSNIAFEDEFIVGMDLAQEPGGIVTKINGEGRVMLPGLIDAHGHILGLGQNLLEIDLRGSQTEDEAVKRVLEFVSANSLLTIRSKKEDTRWLIGRGWNQVLWPTKAFPNKASLDSAIKDRPVVLSRVDGHAVWVNSAALKLAGIDANTPSPAGGEIVKDKNGQPTGVLIDNAEYLVTKLIPKADVEQLSAQLNAASEHLLSLGITSVHDAGISKQVYDFYQQQAQTGQLRFRIYAMISATDPQISDMLTKGHINTADDMLSIRSVKAYGDGALGSRGAALIEPYSDDKHNHGLLVTPQESLPSLFSQVLAANFQLNFHAIGDRANRLALQQFAKTFKIYPENTERHRIEHAQVVAVEDIPLFKELGIIPSMQPTHATSDMNMAEDRIGKVRLKGAYAWKTFLEQGSRVAFGSDFPVELANAFHGLHAAVTRQTPENEPKMGWIPEEKVSIEDALRGFTLDAAYAAFQDDKLGTLEIGKRADFIFIDRDIFKRPASDIRDTQVLETWINGQQVFSKSL